MPCGWRCGRCSKKASEVSAWSITERSLLHQGRDVLRQTLDFPVQRTQFAKRADWSLKLGPVAVGYLVEVGLDE
jgi:hypothetical protein